MDIRNIFLIVLGIAFAGVVVRKAITKSTSGDADPKGVFVFLLCFILPIGGVCLGVALNAWYAGQGVSPALRQLFLPGIPVLGVLLILPIIYFRIFRGNTLGPHEQESLRQNGKLILADFKSIDRRWAIKVNGQSPYVVFCEGTDPATGSRRLFESSDMWYYGGDQTASEKPDVKALLKLINANPATRYQIPVYINSGNPKKYFVDLAGTESIRE